MQPHEQRVVDERNELEGKINKIWEFIGGDIWQSLNKVDQDLLAIQHNAMTAYSATLSARISRFS